MDNPEWSGAPMRNRRAASVTQASTEQVLPFSNSLRSAARRDGETVLALVHQAAEVVRGIEIRANETANYAENIAQRAVERLQSAETRIGELEAERRANQAYISEAHGKIEEAAKALKLERARVKAAENQLCELESRARAAEAHAQDSDSALARIEVAITTQFLGERQYGSQKSSAA